MGAGGMAGHVLSTFLVEQGHQVTSMSARTRLDSETVMLDVRRTDELDAFLVSQDFDAVVNCIGSLVQESELHKSQAVYLNSFLPHHLEEIFHDRPTRVVHLSTDCVFSGASGPYIEKSPTDGKKFYDRSKALGELDNLKDLTLRMSIIGPEIREGGTGLMGWFLSQTGEVRGYSKAIWNGVTTLELAKAIEAILDTEIRGIYHLVPSVGISKYELLVLIKEIFERDDITVIPYDSDPLDKTLVDTRNELGYTVGGYREMLQDLRVWMEQHERLYRAPTRRTANGGGSQ